MEREEEIRLIAYRIWEEEGRPQALDFDRWLKAEAIWHERHTQERSGDPAESPAQQLGVNGKRTRGTSIQPVESLANQLLQLTSPNIRIKNGGQELVEDLGRRRNDTGLPAK